MRYPVKTKRLGRTELDVPVVGMGTAFLGDLARDAPRATWGIDETEAESAIIAAIEAGLTLIDTAPLYGAGGAEVVIGRVLRDRPDLAARCVVTTKVGRTVDGRDYSAPAVHKSVLASRSRLGVETLDVVSIHDAQGQPISEIMSDRGALGALRELQRDGAVRFIGAACSDVDTNAQLVESGEFDVAVTTFSWTLLNQRMADRIGPAAERHDVGLLIAAPLERGLLATGPRQGAVYPSRHFSPEVLAHVGQIQAVCSTYGVPLVAVALQWPSRHPQVAAALAGARTATEAIANAEAAKYEIPDALWLELQPLVKHWDAPHVTR
jgi:D-threo-aldose 1-dehydrogenase